MNYNDLIEQGLNGEAPLKLIMRAGVVEHEGAKVGVVSVVFATLDQKLARERIHALIKANQEQGDYYMVYSVPLDFDLEDLDHFPSIAITKDDLSDQMK